MNFTNFLDEMDCHSSSSMCKHSILVHYVLLLVQFHLISRDVRSIVLHVFRCHLAMHPQCALLYVLYTRRIAAEYWNPLLLSYFICIIIILDLIHPSNTIIMNTF